MYVFCLPYWDRTHFSFISYGDDELVLFGFSSINEKVNNVLEAKSNSIKKQLSFFILLLNLKLTLYF